MAAAPAGVKVEVKAEGVPEGKVLVNPRPEEGSGGGGGGGGGGRGGQGINRGGGGGRNRRGGRGGPGRGFFGGGGGPRGGGGGGFGGGGGGFGGGGGGGGGGNRGPGDRRPFHNNDSFEGPMNKRPRTMNFNMNPEQRALEHIRSMGGAPTADIDQNKFEVKKFAANARLYIGNIPSEATEAEIKDLFVPFGEIDELFLNREKNFGFLKMDYRTNAEKARSALDQLQVKNRPIKVRFSPAPVRVNVKNLSPMVSNELLELAFKPFGDIERALVFIDEKSKSTGEGFVEFTRKNNAASAHKFCTDHCYFITSDLRPVVTEMGEMNEVEEGLLEGNLNKKDREYSSKGGNRELIYYKARERGPRVADPGSFEHDYGMKWKNLIQEYNVKQRELKEELSRNVENMQTEMELAKYDYETELLRQQLRQRELDQEQKMQQRMRFSNAGFGQNGGSGMGGSAEIGSQMMETDNDRSGGGALAPPPMPPQGLMQHLQNDEDEDISGAGAASAAEGGVSWEMPAMQAAFGFNQSNFGGQPPMMMNMRQNEQRGGEGRWGTPPRGMGGGRGGGAPRGGGGRGGFRGGMMRGGRR